MARRTVAASVLVMVVSILGFVGTLVLTGFGGDYDEYGSTSIPGTSRVTLPAGEVDIFFVAYLPSSGGGPVTVPDLKFTLEFADTYRKPVVIDSVGAATTVNTKEHIRVWKLKVKDAGTYTVHADGSVSAYISPSLTFGTGSRFPGWLPFLFGGLFFVSIGGIVVGSRLDDRRPARRRSPVPQAIPEGGPVQPVSPTPVVTVVPNTPDAELARLQQLDQLSSLHSAGALSDEEYAAARARVNGGVQT